jgi:hypothetical protein
LPPDIKRTAHRRQADRAPGPPSRSPFPNDRSSRIRVLLAPCSAYVSQRPRDLRPVCAWSVRAESHNSTANHIRYSRPKSPGTPEEPLLAEWRQGGPPLCRGHHDQDVNAGGAAFSEPPS